MGNIVDRIFTNYDMSNIPTLDYPEKKNKKQMKKLYKKIK